MLRIGDPVQLLITIQTFWCGFLMMSMMLHKEEENFTVSLSANQTILRNLKDLAMFPQM